VEDHARDGGFGSAVLEAAADEKLDTRPLVRLGLPDDWVALGSRAQQLAQAGIDVAGIARAVHEELAQADAASGKPNRSAKPVRRAV